MEKDDEQCCLLSTFVDYPISCYSLTLTCVNSNYTTPIIGTEFRRTHLSWNRKHRGIADTLSAFQLIKKQKKKKGEKRKE